MRYEPSALRFVLVGALAIAACTAKKEDAFDTAAPAMAPLPATGTDTALVPMVEPTTGSESEGVAAALAAAAPRGCCRVPAKAAVYHDVTAQQCATLAGPSDHTWSWGACK